MKILLLKHNSLSFHSAMWHFSGRLGHVQCKLYWQIINMRYALERVQLSVGINMSVWGLEEFINAVGLVNAISLQPH